MLAAKENANWRKYTLIQGQDGETEVGLEPSKHFFRLVGLDISED
jgi:hypothetical protein